MNEYNNINLDDNSSKPKKHTFRKAVAFLMAMVLVSGGSVAVYRGVFESPTSAVEETSKTESNNKSSLAAESVSLIKTADDSEQELSTEEIVQKVLPSVVGIESQLPQ